MNTQSMYLRELLSELKKLPVDAIKEIHDTDAIAVSLPKLALSEAVLDDLAKKWNEGVQLPQRGIYRSYIERTVLRYAQNRQYWKKKFLP